MYKPDWLEEHVLEGIRPVGVPLEERLKADMQESEDEVKPRNRKERRALEKITRSRK